MSNEKILVRLMVREIRYILYLLHMNAVPLSLCMVYTVYINTLHMTFIPIHNNTWIYCVRMQAYHNWLANSARFQEGDQVWLITWPTQETGP